MRQIGFLLSFLLAVSIIFSCTEPTLIGSELLEEDRANLNFKNDIPLTVKTVNGTPVPTYSPFTTLQLNRFLLGQLEDSNFGKNTASVYSQLSFIGDRPVNVISIDDIDSVVLSLAYDTIGNYGDLSQPIDLEVLRVQEDIAELENYTSAQNFVTDPTNIGTASFVPTFDSVQVADYRGEELVFTTEPAHVRIPINKELAKELLSADTMVYQSDTTFKQFFKGLYIRATSPTAGVVAFRFDRAISRLSVYYSVRGDTTEYRYPFIFTNVRTSNFVHESEGAAIGNNINNDNADFLYLQGMAGSNIEVTFPDLSNLENIVVNKAELEFTVASTENLDKFPIVSQLIASSVVNGERAVIDDVRAALIGQNPLNTDVFGGVPVIENNLTTYRINISDHFQDILEGGKTNTITIGAGSEESIYYNAINAKATRANRVILFGPNHPTFSPKLNLTFTTL